MAPTTFAHVVIPRADVQPFATVPEAGAWLGLGEGAAYRSAQRGEIPTLKLGRKLVVPVAELRRKLGLDN